MNNQLTIKDLYEASYLIAKGFPLKRMERIGQTLRCLFVFDDSPEIHQASTDFWNKQALVDAKTYAEQITYLKDRIHAGM